jgi:hypothetical protein
VTAVSNNQTLQKTWRGFRGGQASREIRAFFMRYTLALSATTFH